MARGDRLQVRRRLFGLPLHYMHHGIDMGDGTVVHARPDDTHRLFAGGRIVQTTLDEFAQGAVVEAIAEPLAVFPADEVARRALAHVGREGYCPVVDNCEHFATWCATGERRSRQVDAVISGVGRIAAAVAMMTIARTAAAAVTNRSR